MWTLFVFFKWLPHTYTIQAIELAKRYECDAKRDLNDSSNPFLPNFYLIKFGSSQSIIPKWEGAVRITYTSGLDNQHDIVFSLRKTKSPVVWDSDEDSGEDDSEDKNPASFAE